MSSTISSSDHLRDWRETTNGRSFVVNMDGRFSAGAFVKRFCDVSIPRARTYERTHS